MGFFDRFWHERLGRPYKLYRRVDGGKGRPVVLLHGIGRSGKVWRRVVDGLQFFPYRVVVFDLLGFGESPKPKHVTYTVDDHAAAVIAAIERLHLKEPAVLAGHSMGCLVAVRVARLRPDLVEHLVLYEMPLYEGLPEKRSYQVRQNFYFRIYQRMVKYQPAFDAEHMGRLEQLLSRVAGFTVSRETWPAFVKSLENTIMKQTAAEDIKELRVPMDVIYGSRDMLVIRGKAKEIFGEDKTNITDHTIRASHVISEEAAKFIVQRIVAGEQRESAHGR
jgi:pimeloyl-ACP methyl ester carboxylesterase